MTKAELVERCLDELFRQAVETAEKTSATELMKAYWKLYRVSVRSIQDLSQYKEPT